MKKIAFAFAFAAFVSCGGDDDLPDFCDDCPDVSSSGGNSSSDGVSGNSSSSGNGNSSSSGIGGGNSSSSGSGNSSSSGGGNPNPSNPWTGWPFDDSGENLQASPECPSYSDPVEITYNNGGSPDIINHRESEVSVEKNGENVTVTLSGAEEHNLRISGTAQNGSLKVYGGSSRVVLYLNGVNIKNNSGPALNFQKGKRVTVCLVSGKENYLDGASAAPQGDEQAKGAFFSEEKLYFTGNGSLEVKARRGHQESSGHAIVVDNDFEIDNGKIIISEAAGDGIHVNEKIEVKGGVIKIASTGDALQSEKPVGSVVITGGKILARTTGIKSHGITSEGAITISENAKVQINVSGNGSKGIKSTSYTEIKGGTIAIRASGDRDQNDADTSTAAGIKVDADLFIEGGNTEIRSPGSKAKGINAINIDMTSGNVRISADDDGIKVHGTLKMRGGSIVVESRNKDIIDGTVNQTGGTINGSGGR